MAPVQLKRLMRLQTVLVLADWSLSPFMDVFVWSGGGEGGAVLSTLLLEPPRPLVKEQ